MKIQFWSVGKAHENYVKEGIDLFTKRIAHYYPVEWKLIATPKALASANVNEVKKAEGEKILQLLKPEDALFVLDERGKEFTSDGLANLIQAKANESIKNLVFLIGGAYGTDKMILQRASLQWSLSKLVLPHQLVRLILAEQVYRACTILRNEKYHHC
ncbi:MAG: 23S rRNA (pseudouridine(1915)-N(3))-methyltransferase RlmH [Chitinophagaceae bacterium]|nr:23S rRNA (pseudouridine(1915)-N(3))-methyltransferase RlmH [Chitinophagaceae bacterium]HEV8084786.1 23S rRNA (pseudouridine(1915)-N(3))-methyltransferase RlmH [Chitinophagaceae bacterium]